MTTIYEQLKQTRKKLHLSQSALGSKLGLPQSHLSKIESGQVNLRFSSLTEIARLLGLEIMLVPRQSVSMIEAIINNDEDALQQPRWQPDEE